MGRQRDDKHVLTASQTPAYISSYGLPGDLLIPIHVIFYILFMTFPFLRKLALVRITNLFSHQLFIEHPL